MRRERDQKLHRGAGRGRVHNLGSERAHAAPLSAGDRHLPASCVVCTRARASATHRTQLAAHVKGNGRARARPWTSSRVSGTRVSLLLLPSTLPMTPGGVYSPNFVEQEFSEVRIQCFVYLTPKAPGSAPRGSYMMPTRRVSSCYVHDLADG